MLLFNPNKIKLNRDKTAYIEKKYRCPLFSYAADDIIDRLDLINFDFQEILDINVRYGDLFNKLKEKYSNSKFYCTDISFNMLNNIKNDYKFFINTEEIEFADNSFDLITFSLGMHYINDIQNFLKRIYCFLNDNGIFIVNLIGGGSLKNLRYTIILAEERCGNMQHSSHIIPYLRFDDITTLLQNAGFNDIVADYETIQLEYPSAYSLMKDIKNAGESNIMYKSNNYSISKNMLKILQSTDTVFKDSLDLISFIAAKKKHTIIL